MLKSIIFYISTILCAATAFAQQPAMDDLKQQTQTARQEIQKTSQKIKQNKPPPIRFIPKKYTFAAHPLMILT